VAQVTLRIVGRCPPESRAYGATRQRTACPAAVQRSALGPYGGLQRFCSGEFPAMITTFEPHPTLACRHVLRSYGPYLPTRTIHG
jgi:hypothetical protein